MAMSYQVSYRQLACLNANSPALQRPVLRYELVRICISTFLEISFCPDLSGRTKPLPCTSLTLLPDIKVPLLKAKTCELESLRAHFVSLCLTALNVILITNTNQTLKQSTGRFTVVSKL